MRFVSISYTKIILKPTGVNRPMIFEILGWDSTMNYIHLKSVDGYCMWYKANDFEIVDMEK